MIVTEEKDKSNKNQRHKKIQSFNSKTDLTNKSKIECWLCSEAHKIWSCPKFLEKAVDRRKDAKDYVIIVYNCLSII